VAGINPYPDGAIEKEYNQRSIKKRLEAFFLDNVGRVVTRQMIIDVSIDPITKIQPENWHQRLSELRTDDGYTILSNRDRAYLTVQQYVLESSEKRETAGKRVLPTKAAWHKVIERSGNRCEWADGGYVCGLQHGDLDPVGGGTVKLTPDHMQPHSVNPNADPSDITQWQALCGRHQVIKKNFWDSSSGKINTLAVMQALPQIEKLIAYSFLKEYFGD
jgi:hypothetical protein